MYSFTVQQQQQLNYFTSYKKLVYNKEGAAIIAAKVRALNRTV